MAWLAHVSLPRVLSPLSGRFPQLLTAVLPALLLALLADVAVAESPEVWTLKRIVVPTV
jgi:hypothetical protein